VNTHTIAYAEELYPVLKIKAYQHLQLLQKEGIDGEIDCGVRTWPEQTIDWQKGRNPDGSFIDPVHRTGVVTYAKAGQSWHNYGCAYDVFIMTASGIDWTGTSPAWKRAIVIGESLGLVAGAEWHGNRIDRPHFQFTNGRFPVTPDDEVLILFRGGGMMSIWKEIDASLDNSK
jgi:peptidoglycan L-alanyl-D-glutamate endopeptidase CwlK